MPVYTFTTLDDPLGMAAVAFGISDAGQVVGAYTDANVHGEGFLYSGGTFATLDDPLGSGGTNARGINDAGQIVGEYFDASNSEHSFLYSASTFTSLAEPSGTTIAFGINDAGQIVGRSEERRVGKECRSRRSREQ